ncbi:Dps family protein [Oceanivirga salmonicida]|uniref:Dps family protein n=1 Tax=Oceanivirga salmonicida TaxID=1769291 RepID=UPI001E499EAF|nr:DNA starvation/stationary phase protection protein [Oceanivirga salmonicida]
MEAILNQFLADLSVLSKKVQNYHWNIEGKGFFTLHKQLDEIYENLNDEVDEIAERLLALELRPLSNFKSYLETTEIVEAGNEPISIDRVLDNLIIDFKYMVRSAKEIKVLADDEEDYGTSAIIDEFIINSEKLLWMLRASR